MTSTLLLGYPALGIELESSSAVSERLATRPNGPGSNMEIVFDKEALNKEIIKKYKNISI